MRIVLLAMMMLMCAGAGPTTRPARGPAPVVESSGPLRLARYTKPFLPPAPSQESDYTANRYYYASPSLGGYPYIGWPYFYSGGYCGWPTTGVAPSGAYSPGW